MGKEEGSRRRWRRREEKGGKEKGGGRGKRKGREEGEEGKGGDPFQYRSPSSQLSLPICAQEVFKVRERERKGRRSEEQGQEGGGREEETGGRREGLASHFSSWSLKTIR
jgi:hypothetical protein